MKKWKVKVCGNAHAYCNLCRLTNKKYTIKSCGKQHAACKVCKPEGFGFTGKHHTIETKEKQRNALKGKKRPTRSKEWGENISLNKLGKTHKGTKHTKETRLKLSKIHKIRMKKHMLLKNINCKCFAHHMYSNSKLGSRMIAKFLFNFPEVREEVQFGKYRVDAYIPPPYHLAFEADGDYWHNRPGAKEHDKFRDKQLLERFNLYVIRITQREIDS